MSIHTTALKQACTRLNLPFKTIGKTGVFLAVKINNKDHYFIANKVPINNSAVVTIVRDKGHSYDLLSSVINMPRSVAFLDPNAEELYQPYITHKTLEEIAATCEDMFAYPFILKKNSGSQGVNVFKCTTKQEVTNGLTHIFDQHSVEYDHVALAQEYIDIEKEYRVTVLDRQIELIYQKDNAQATFTGNLSPLHWEGAKAVLIQDRELLARLSQFISPVFSVLDLEYGGLDIAIDKKGKIWLFEINSHPAYDHLVSSANIDVLVELYKKILRFLGG